MDITLTLDLPGIIKAACAPERLQPLLDKAVTEALKDAITESTGYRSDFRKELKRQLDEAMPKGLAIDDVAKFQQVFNRAISNAVQGENAATIHAALQAAAKQAMPDVPTSIKLSKLLEAAREGFHTEEHEAFYAHLEMGDYGYGALYLDDNPDTKEKYRADIRLAFNKDGEVYGLKLDGRDLTPASLPNAVGPFDGLLLAMYTGRTALEIDCDTDDVEDAARAKEYD